MDLRPEVERWGNSYVFFGLTEVQLSKLQIFFGIPFLKWQEYTLPILPMFLSLPFHPILFFLLLSSEFQLRQLAWRKLGINSTYYKEKNNFIDIFKDILEKALLLLGSKDYIVCFWHQIQRKSQLGNKIELVTGKGTERCTSSTQCYSNPNFLIISFH